MLEELLQPPRPRNLDDPKLLLEGIRPHLRDILTSIPGFLQGAEVRDIEGIGIYPSTR